MSLHILSTWTGNLKDFCEIFAHSKKTILAHKLFALIWNLFLETNQQSVNYSLNQSGSPSAHWNQSTKSVNYSLNQSGSSSAQWNQSTKSVNYSLNQSSSSSAHCNQSTKSVNYSLNQSHSSSVHWNQSTRSFNVRTLVVIVIIITTTAVSQSGHLLTSFYVMCRARSSRWQDASLTHQISIGVESLSILTPITPLALLARQLHRHLEHVFLFFQSVHTLAFLLLQLLNLHVEFIVRHRKHILQFVRHLFSVVILTRIRTPLGYSI